jgi:hypothetical protein
MGSRADCIAKTSRTPDGIRISGHIPSPLLAVRDKDTDRVYYIGQCTNCGVYDAGFTEGGPVEEAELRHYDVVLSVGGPTHD